MLGEDRNLKCAHCGEDYLHHLEIQVFARPREDGKTYQTNLDATSPKVAFPRIALNGNPSMRRSGVKILLSCENCPGITALTIAQHKGFTLIEAERAPYADFSDESRQAGEAQPPAPPY